MLTGKKPLTGGNSGIGLAPARLFVAEGAQVAITGRDLQTLDEAIAELGSSARRYRADITVAEDRDRLSLPSQKISGTSTSSSPMPGSRVGRLPGRLTRQFLRT